MIDIVKGSRRVSKQVDKEYTGRLLQQLYTYTASIGVTSKGEKPVLPKCAGKGIHNGINVSIY